MAYAIYILPCLENFTKDIFIFSLKHDREIYVIFEPNMSVGDWLEERFLKKRKEMYRKEFNKFIICADIYIQTAIYSMVSTFTVRK
jgi:hypothetical protein